MLTIFNAFKEKQTLLNCSQSTQCLKGLCEHKDTSIYGSLQMTISLVFYLMAAFKALKCLICVLAILLIMKNANSTLLIHRNCINYYFNIIITVVAWLLRQHHVGFKLCLQLLTLVQQRNTNAFGHNSKIGKYQMPQPMKTYVHEASEPLPCFFFIFAHFQIRTNIEASYYCCAQFTTHNYEHILLNNNALKSQTNIDIYNFSAMKSNFQENKQVLLFKFNFLFLPAVTTNAGAVMSAGKSQIIK